MLNSFFNFLKNINDNYANVILAILAILTFYTIYHEYILKIRPYVLPEIIIEKKDDGSLFFYASLVNKGAYPGIAKLTNVLLKVGDEEYSTPFKNEFILAPNENKKLFEVGNINTVGIKKIRGHEYRSNRVEIELEALSKSIGDKEYKFKTKVVYEVDVSMDVPALKLISEEI